MPANGAPSVLIIGTGFGGIGMAIELRRAGFRDIVLLEKAADIGGVWRENTYPGAGCDIPSPYYSYSYEPKPDWPMRFSLRADIQEYLRRTADKYGVTGLIRFNTEVTAAAFDADRGLWRVETATGATYEANVLIPAVGQLSRPAWPNLAGRERFTGPAFHSAEWDHGTDLTGKRVAVIGTGASAIQFVPLIQPKVARLTLFQRTAPYIVPKTDTVYRPWQHAMYRRLPRTQLAERAFFWGLCEFATVGLKGNRAITKAVEWLSAALRARQIKDRELRAKLTPDHPAGCKRVLFASNYYPAVAAPNVRLETGRIAEITPGGVRTGDGVEHPADVIIYATGFRTTEFLGPMKVLGLAGRDLREYWSDGARAYLGMSVPGFPNMFLMYGPNTNLGCGSIIYMLERQARYIRQAVEHIAAGTSYVDVRPEVADHFDAEVQRRLARSVWSMCRSWYREDGGRVSTNWPGLVSEYDRRTKTLDLADYQVVVR
ncbi:MAG TPA: NAD(P)/FAD-dependent oxidoreductase [Actinophytocola sp.]|uniref:flavin-containing monooxygenase n=1 Tax=Actinophytocola sp. TaxID=1872138 RepID=UPI002DB583D4|nr:NAD(P)/FAD-dependent oxidoreductase [Actinophytocola sp.]HEU5471460.1 NAD(P)/FAD-dependent oxidoreductase [Actinophytocola sp.]